MSEPSCPSMLDRLQQKLITFWRGVRNATGDDAYQRYLDHWYATHKDDQTQPLGRREFFQAEQQRKWNRPNRCC